MVRMEYSLVSIIMPAFNAEKYIKESILSVFNQTYQNWELLIINDGSTDSTKEIIQSFNDSRIHYFEQVNKGVSAARNIGLFHMKGDYFCFLDADDSFTPKSIENRLIVFGKSNSIQFVDGKIEICDETINKVLRTRIASVEGQPFFYLLNLHAGVFFGPTWMIKRNHAVTYSFNEEMKYLEDLYFYFTICHQGEYSFTNEVILKYRTHSQSAMKNLEGIAEGYTQLVSFVMRDFTSDLNVVDKIVLKLKVRKIMLLSFLAANQTTKALRYLVFGHL